VIGKRKGWSGVGVAHASNCYALQWLRDSHLGIVGRFSLAASLLSWRTFVGKTYACTPRFDVLPPRRGLVFAFYHEARGLGALIPGMQYTFKLVLTPPSTTCVLTRNPFC
jgi:hypothetical protein